MIEGLAARRLRRGREPVRGARPGRVHVTSGAERKDILVIPRTALILRSDQSMFPSQRGRVAAAHARAPAKTVSTCAEA